MTPDALREAVRLLVIEELGLDADGATAGGLPLTDTSRFNEDLGADSLDRLQLTMRVEEEFGLEIPTPDADGIETFGQLVAYLAARMDVST